MLRKTALSVFLGATSVVAVLLPQNVAAAQTRTATASPQVQVLSADSHRLVGAERRPSLGGPGGFINCPPGYHPSPFDMPIYDDDGLFVVGYETVWFCIPDDLEPAG